MANAYITLTNSDSSLVKKYRVTADSYQDREEVLETRQITITGKTDMQTGPSKRFWSYDLLVWETDPTDGDKGDADTAGYGTLAHLQTFFRYRDPSATPTNRLTLTDHEGGTHTVYMRGNMIKKPMGTALVGTSAVFRVNVTLEEYD